MTLLLATATFQENKKGTLEKKKWATFVILDKPLKSESNFAPNFAWKLFIKGKAVYSAE